jgi:hypothetical protein
MPAACGLSLLEIRMTVRLLTDYPPYKAGQLLTTDANTEAGLVAQKMADTNLAGGAPQYPAIRVASGSHSYMAADVSSATLVSDYASGVTVTNAAVRTVGSSNALPPYLGARVIEMVHSATDSHADITVSIDKATFTCLAFEVYHPGTSPQVFTLYVSETSGFTGGTYASLNFVAMPGLHVYAFNRGAFVPNGAHSVASAGTYTTIRVKEQTDAQAAAGTFYYPALSGQAAYIGPMRVIKGAKAVVFFHTDDIHAINMAASTYGPSLVSLFAQYGIRGNLNITTEFANTSGKLTWAQCRSVQDDYGWCVVQQGDKDAIGDGTNPQQGMRMYRFFNAAATTLAGRFASTNTLITDGPTVTALIQADISTARDKLYANGLRSGLSHISIPQGGFDDRVEAAITAAGSFKTVRGVCVPNAGERTTVNMPVANHNGQNALAVMGGTYNATVPRGTVINMPSALSLEDDTITFGDGSTKDPKAFIDEAVRCGGMTSFYTHQLLTQATADRIRATLAYAKQLQDQGLLQIATLADVFGA